MTIDSPYLPPDELARELEKALEASIAVSRSRAQTPATPKPRAGEHTKGPWHVENHFVVMSQLNIVASMLGSMHIDQANARRIVACVNALEGVSLEAIENGGRSGSVMQALGIERDRAKVLLEATQRQYIEAKAERDLLREREKALVAAIEAALGYCESEAVGTVQQEIADNERMRQTLRNALEYGR